MRHIVVIAYQLHYYKGSEYSVAWNYVKNMSREAKLTVIYGTSNGHHNIGNTCEMEDYMKEHPMTNVECIALKPSFTSKNHDFSIMGQYRFYREYKKWHKDVYKYVKALCKREHIDLIHYLGPIGYREPGYLHKLPVPYIRGPIGGLGGVNLKLLKATGSFGIAIQFFVKRVLNEIQFNFSKRNLRALRDADVVICATSEQQDRINKKLGKIHHSIILFNQENCLDRMYPLNIEKFDSKTIRLIFVGSIDGRKGLALIIEALRYLPTDAPLVLDIVGEGFQEAQLIKKAKGLGVDHFVNWHGKIPRDDVFKMMNEAHLMVLPSLHEGNPTTIWEAMSMGVPSLTLKNCGMRDTVNDYTGFSIPIQSYSQVVREISEVLKIIINNPEVLRIKAEAVIKDREQYTWKDRYSYFEHVYELAEEQFKKRKA